MGIEAKEENLGKSKYLLKLEESLKREKQKRDLLIQQLKADYKRLQFLKSALDKKERKIRAKRYFEIGRFVESYLGPLPIEDALKIIKEKCKPVSSQSNENETNSIHVDEHKNLNSSINEEICMRSPTDTSKTAQN